LPDQVEMCVQPVCTCVGVCTPVDPLFFDDSASPVATGLNYSYGSDVSYSRDGSDFSYIPIPDGAGFDGNVRYVRVNPTGTMVAPDVAGNPWFLLRYVVRLQ